MTFFVITASSPSGQVKTLGPGPLDRVLGDLYVQATASSSVLGLGSIVVQDDPFPTEAEATSTQLDHLDPEVSLPTKTHLQLALIA